MLSGTMFPMSLLSMRQAAKKLGLSVAALSRYVATNKVPAPKPERIGGLLVYAWKDEDIERVRKILPQIANGRKTRHKRKAKKTGKKK
jgi:predicted DNA-binding transcriptional regulator AlpA